MKAKNCKKCGWVQEKDESNRHFCGIKKYLKKINKMVVE